MLKSTPKTQLPLLNKQHKKMNQSMRPAGARLHRVSPFEMILDKLRFNITQN